MFRELLHTKKRKDEACEQLRAVLGDSMTNCDIEPASEEIATCLQASPLLPPAITEEMFNLDLSVETPTGCQPLSTSPAVTVDNSLSPAHTLIQILCRDHKGLLYDIMRTLKDYKIQVITHGDSDIFVIFSSNTQLLLARSLVVMPLCICCK